MPPLTASSWDIYRQFLCIMGYSAGNKQKLWKYEMRWLRLLRVCPPHNTKVCSIKYQPQIKHISCHIPRVYHLRLIKHTLTAAMERLDRLLIDIVSKVKHMLMRSPPLPPSSISSSACMRIWFTGPGNVARIRGGSWWCAIHSASVDIFAAITINNSRRRVCLRVGFMDQSEGACVPPVHYLSTASVHYHCATVVGMCQ